MWFNEVLVLMFSCTTWAANVGGFLNLVSKQQYMSPPAEKDAISHRGQALRALLPLLVPYLTD